MKNIVFCGMLQEMSCVCGKAGCVFACVYLYVCLFVCAFFSCVYWFLTLPSFIPYIIRDTPSLVDYLGRNQSP